MRDSARWLRLLARRAPGRRLVDVDDLPPAIAPDKDATLIVKSVADAIGRGHREHEGVADDGRVAIVLQTRLQQIETKTIDRARPAILDHEKMKIQPVLPVGGDDPFVERQVRAGCGSIGLHVAGKDTTQMAVQKIPNFLL